MAEPNEPHTLAQAINHAKAAFAKAKTPVALFLCGGRLQTLSTSSPRYAVATRHDDGATKFIGVYDPTCPEAWYVDDLRDALKGAR